MKLIVGNEKVDEIRAIRIFRIVQFINSEHAGFRCSNIFLMEKRHILTAFLEVIANSILIYDMSYLFF